MTTTEVIEAGSNSTGNYYRLNLRTKGGLVAPTVVKHCTRFDTMVCLSCVAADQCVHSRIVRRHLEANAEPRVEQDVKATAAVR